MKDNQATALIRNQKQRAAFEKQWWDELERIADTEKVCEFYEKYAQYLKENGIISRSRQLLYKMAVKASKL